MISRIFRSIALCLVVFYSLSSWAGDAIPKIAWKRAIGEPFANPGTRKPELEGLIDDGYWQGAPVGGLGSGPFPHLPRRFFSLAFESRHSQIRDCIREPVRNLRKV